MTDNSKPANQPEEKHWLDQFKEAWFRDNNILPIKELNEYWKDTERHAYMAYQYIRRYVLNAAHRADEGDREYATHLKEENQRLRETLEGIIKSWDAGCPEREQHKRMEEHDFSYWSPASSFVKSEFIAAARQALSTKQKGE